MVVLETQPLGIELLVGVLAVVGIGYVVVKRRGGESTEQSQQRRQQPTVQQRKEGTARLRKLEHLIYLVGMVGGGVFVLLGAGEPNGGALIAIGLIAMVFCGYRFQTRPL